MVRLDRKRIPKAVLEMKNRKIEGKMEGEENMTEGYRRR